MTRLNKQKQRVENARIVWESFEDNPYTAIHKLHCLAGDYEAIKVQAEDWCGFKIDDETCEIFMDIAKEYMSGGWRRTC